MSKELDKIIAKHLAAYLAACAAKDMETARVEYQLWRHAQHMKVTAHESLVRRTESVHSHTV